MNRRQYKVLILSIMMIVVTSAQSQSYFHYRPFDSTRVFIEKVVVPFDSCTNCQVFKRADLLPHF
jgi:hypothetical protein